MAGLVVFAAVEGIVDEAVVRRILGDVEGSLAAVYGKNGKGRLRKRIGGYNHAAEKWPWFVVVDLDADFECAPLLRQEWLPRPSEYMCFRVAVRQVEAWLLGDREKLGEFLGVEPGRIPRNPEVVGDPKEEMVNLARRSRRRRIREDMVPRGGGGRRVGPAYASRMVEFVGTYWRPAIARQEAPSLDRALRCLEELARKLRVG